MDMDKIKFISTLLLTSLLDCAGGQCHAPAAPPLGKSWYLMYGRLGGPQGWPFMKKVTAN